MAAIDAAAPGYIRDRRTTARRAHVILSLVCAASMVASLAIGPAGTSLWGAFGQLLRSEPLSTLDQVILRDIRLPRMVLGALVGAALAISGAVLQGLFRNPLADPGIVGVSAGAALGATSAIVLGAMLPVAVQNIVGNALIPLAAFFGSWISVFVLYRVATHRGRTSVITMLLGGIALAALAAACMGVLIYIADDAQLRDLTFWNLGSLGGATWVKVATAGPMIVLAVGGAVLLGRALNALALGEAAAHHLGVPVQQMKRWAILCVAAATGSAVAVAGTIGFIGIVVPHLLRLSTGPDHGPLLINSALLGAALLVWADVIARLIVAPAELPIGIITAILGAPVFLWILLRQRGSLMA
ncbi:iron ABC transporter permease [Pseudohalocynthiibacter aestuariivivens]|uniref:Iron ABC transporter permease n=1 Tax=Roseovarius pelagicus TaxID=2980108 RepID=A0ABY6D8D2_9RHOB|nr:MULTISPECIES: iron ABC transporter permease [Rhodobacterales]QIE45694.1 iron ABC transporter permease [Pseudohalocynthiibacter aestuariivivens]UXX82387.1 iron ABC transporter permease [Roseovarius pelagicus]